MSAILAILARDITAGELAMDAPDGDGYPADHVIGRAGTTIHITEDGEDGMVEADSFSEDPYACGWIPVSALDGGLAGV